MLLILLYALFVSAAITSCDGAFTTSRDQRTPRWGGDNHCPRKARRASDDHGVSCVDDDGIDGVRTITTHYETHLASGQEGEHRYRKFSRRRRFRRGGDDAPEEGTKLYRFTYDYNVMTVGGGCTSSNLTTTTTGIMLIHPIGVGIGKWYYDRLLTSLRDRVCGDVGGHRYIFLVPDLLGSATASGPTDDIGGTIPELPLLNVTDWSRQIAHLMADHEAMSEAGGFPVGSWAIVANGGCSPMALQAAASSSSGTAPFKAALTNVVISSPPKLSFFLDPADPVRVRNSYRTLSGIVGRLFWWYSLRRNGRFIRKFSERNLVGDPTSLGTEWTPNCLMSACLHDGRSRYSTFAFLAGALQDGCAESLNAMNNVSIDFIRGSDGRRNRAKSWFWSRKGRRAGGGDPDDDDEGGAADPIRNDDTTLTEGSIRQFVHDNGYGGRELFVGGRISLAWEDPNGYADRLMELLREYN